MAITTSFELYNALKDVMEIPKQVRSLTIQLGPGDPVIVTAQYYPDIKAKDVALVMSKYRLTPVGEPVKVRLPCGDIVEPTGDELREMAGFPPEEDDAIYGARQGSWHENPWND